MCSEGTQIYRFYFSVTPSDVMNLVEAYIEFGFEPSCFICKEKCTGIYCAVLQQAKPSKFSPHKMYFCLEHAQKLHMIINIMSRTEFATGPEE